MPSPVTILPLESSPQRSLPAVEQAQTPATGDDGFQKLLLRERNHAQDGGTTDGSGSADGKGFPPGDSGTQGADGTRGVPSAGGAGGAGSAGVHAAGQGARLGSEADAARRVPQPLQEANGPDGAARFALRELAGFAAVRPGQAGVAEQGRIGSGTRTAAARRGKAARAGKTGSSEPDGKPLRKAKSGLEFAPGLPVAISAIAPVAAAGLVRGAVARAVGGVADASEERSPGAAFAQTPAAVVAGIPAIAGAHASAPSTAAGAGILEHGGQGEAVAGSSQGAAGGPGLLPGSDGLAEKPNASGEGEARADSQGSAPGLNFATAGRARAETAATPAGAWGSGEHFGTATDARATPRQASAQSSTQAVAKAVPQNSSDGTAQAASPAFSGPAQVRAARLSAGDGEAASRTARRTGSRTTPGESVPGVTAASVGGGIGVARPSTAQVAEKAGTAQAAGSGADIHALLDTNPLAANASWRASANHLEAGVALDDRTWVAVEATRQGGAVNVGVHAVAGGEAQSLAGLIAGVSAHLQERRVEVGELSLSLRQEHAGAGADMAGGGGAGYSQRQAQQNLLPSGRETGPARDAAPNRAGAGGAELRDGELGRAFRRISLQA